MQDDIRQDVLLCNKVNQMETHNFCSLKILTNCTWNLDRLEWLLHDYHDKEIEKYLRYGFPISQFKTTGSTYIPQNWSEANVNYKSVKRYFQVELKNKAVMSTFNENPFNHCAFYSPLNTRDKKDRMEKRIIVDMSFPKGNSINDDIKKDEYQNKKFTSHTQQLKKEGQRLFAIQM